MKNKKFVAIPREIIFNEKLGNERVTVYSYLYGNTNNMGKFNFTTVGFCNYVGLKPNYRGKRINARFYDCLKKLSDLGYVEDIGFEEMSKEQTNSKTVRVANVDEDKFESTNGFGIVYYDEVETISNFKELLKNEKTDIAGLSSYHILLVLAYLRINIHKNNLNSKDPETCYRYYFTISEELNLSERYVAKAVNTLSALGIISFIRMQPILREQNGEMIKRDGVKIFANKYRYIKNENGETVLDKDYDSMTEIERQRKLIIKWRIDKYNKQILEMEENLHSERY